MKPQQVSHPRIVFTPCFGRTKYANFVADVIILHEELVAPHHMLIKVPSKSLVQSFRDLSKEWRNDAWLDVCSYTRLG